MVSEQLQTAIKLKEFNFDESSVLLQEGECKLSKAFPVSYNNRPVVH